jgi:hypothetical protein
VTDAAARKTWRLTLRPANSCPTFAIAPIQVLN